MSSAILFDSPARPKFCTGTTLKPLVPRTHEVVIGVEAAGVNNADLMQRRGHYPVPDWGATPAGARMRRHDHRRRDRHRKLDGRRPRVPLLDGGGYADEVAVPATQVHADPSRPQYGRSGSRARSRAPPYYSISQ